MEEPDPRFTKLNVDATFFAHEGIGATTAILRDEGNFIVAHWRFVAIAADAITTEAMAMRDGLLDIGSSIGKVIFEHWRMC